MKSHRIRFGGPNKRAIQSSSLPDRLNIETLTLDGRGFARANGKAVFIRDAIPGDLISAKLVKQSRGYDEASLEKIIQPSPDRIEPECEYYTQCGGCDLQHISASKALALKESEVLNQLKHHARIEPKHIDPPIRSPQVFGYRRSARIGINQRESGELLLGFRRRASSKLINIDQCPVLEPRINAFLADLRATLVQEAKVKHITQLLVSAGSSALCAELRVTKKLNEELTQALKGIAETHQVELSLSLGEALPEVISSSLSHCHYEIDTDVQIEFSASDFLQANAAVNLALVARVIEWMQPKSEDRLLDLYAGLGNFSLPLAKRVKEVVAVEGSKEMVQRCMENAALNSLSNIVAFKADLSQPDPNALWLKPDYSLVLLDPPRTGAAAMIDALKEIRPRALVYIACDPASLVRDTKTLIAQGYRMDRFCIADMFPQTHHIESLAIFVRD